MDSAYYGLTIVAIFVILFWYIQNERKSPDDTSLGLLATKDFSTSAADSRRKTRKFSLKPPEIKYDEMEDVGG